MIQSLSSGNDLPLVRRLEAVGFRAWPAASVVYDGSWQVRLTPGHPSKRLNCIVPLDPSDHRDMDRRLEKAAAKFAAGGRRLLVRETPLAPVPMLEHLDRIGWRVFETVDVLTADLVGMELPDTLDYLPSHDVNRFIEASLSVGAEDPTHRDGLCQILSGIRPNSGFFIKQDRNLGSVATLLCVQDNDLAGIMSFAVAESARRAGIGTEILTAALRWARISGARTAWLQVVSENLPALALYEKFGFRRAYQYRYWRSAKEGSGA
ncbi:GNAT family N-acetyltransferase [Neorhizobium sp. SOG26]|uniref:GNAT family N-acetyltransferase n=1 Tax=Neorhizobium sp. SOG26 TaxID=2060726 RepID=UPI000E58FF1A|nr:GNAT family N-acetyltransferase [Neorhizobium sp. SOG26]AXV17410.1 GNAT family N-acetyltransferase [Neorhizobium sp. SOG26]